MDGVICPEFEWMDDPDWTHEKVMLRTEAFKPVFQPTGDYVIITGRKERPGTLFWIYSKLSNKPKQVHINLDNIDPVKFKADILNANPDITTFIESEMKQVEYLRANTRQTILHIDDLLPKEA
jgi:hypothetical protein